VFIEFEDNMVLSNKKVISKILCELLTTGLDAYDVYVNGVLVDETNENDLCEGKFV